MNKSSPSSSPPTPPFRPTSAATTATRLTPAVIPLNYNYRIMSPSSYTHSNTRPSSTYVGIECNDEDTLDNQYGSIFGDPVPPPPPADFYDFKNAQHFPRLFKDIGSIEEETSRHLGHARLFPKEPFNTVMSRCISTPSIQQQNFNLTTPHSSRARLQPPDIQILPNSSGASSSDQLGSPNFTLLRPDDILTKPALYENVYATDVSEILETLTVNDATGFKEYSEVKRRVSNISDDFRSNVGTFCHARTDEPTSTPKPLLRRDSNESYSSEDWFRPATRDFPEFSKIPKLRPSSKNIMSIKNNEMPTQFSPVAAMFNDSSSSEDRVTEPPNKTSTEFHKLAEDIAPLRPPVPCPEAMFELQEDSTQRRQSLCENTEQPFISPTPVPPSRPVSLQEELETSESSKREMSPVIKTNLIATGGDHRVQTPRLHKKTSFTILSDKSTQSSLAPTPNEYTQRRSSIGTPSIVNRPVALPRYHLPQKSLTSTQLKLPQIQTLKQFTSDDSPRQSVQFDMTGRLSPFKMSQKGILQHRESLSSSQDALSPVKFPYGQKHRSYEALPMLTDPYRTSIPRLNRSALDIGKEPAIFPPGSITRPLRPNPNPTRRQKGLLRVFTREEILSRIPLRSNWNSMDDLSFNRFRKHRLAPMALQKRRRSSSTSPERRSSTQTVSDRRSSNLSSVTTSDFSFRRPSIMSSMQQRRSSIAPPTMMPKRRQSIVGKPTKGLRTGASRTKISKPTTLSPIIGTPNKDSSTPQSPVHIAMHGPSSDSPSDISRRESFSKIPVRRGSHSSSHLPSRSGSPAKELLTTQLPISDRTSQATSSRSPSRTTIRNDSPQVSSRSPSRSLSRASTKPMSTVPSRASSRPNSRMEPAKQVVNSRSNSRASGRTTPRSGRSPLSKRNTPEITNRKSISLSPQPRPKAVVRRGSLSPTKQNLRTSRSLSKSRFNDKSSPQRTSRSRIPRRASVTSRNSMSPPKAKSPVARTKKTSPTKSKPGGKSKETTSVKKATTSARKIESSVKRTASSVAKPIATTKKQPSIIQKARQKIQDEASKIQKKPLKKKEASSPSMKKASNSTKKEIGNKKSTALKTQNIGDNKKTQTKATAKAQVAAADSSQENLKGNADQASSQGEVLKSTTAEVDLDGAVAAAAGAAVAAAVVSGIGREEAKSEVENSRGGSASTGGMRKAPSAVSLIRMGSRMSLFSKKRPDSSLGRQIAEEESSENENKSEEGVQRIGTPLTPEAVAILERSQKTLENVQKTVSVATDEIQKTINANLTDLKSLESDVAKVPVESVGSAASSAATVVENKTATPRVEHKSDAKGSSMQPVEADVSIINHEATASDKTAFDTSERNFELGVTSKSGTAMAAAGNEDQSAHLINDSREQHSDDFKVDAKRRSPDGQGGSTAGSGGKTGSQEEFLKPIEDEEKRKGCCFCFNKLCLPCRRSSCAKCCRRKKPMPMDESEEPVLSATSSATTTNLELIDEKKSKSKGYWQRFNCCKSCRKSKNSAASTRTMELNSEPQSSANRSGLGPRNQSKCGLCLSKIFCCRSVNKVDPTTGHETHGKNCCFCIPCRRKKSGSTAAGSAAWQDPELAISATDASVLAGIPTETKPGCCNRFWSKLLCCKKKKVPKGTESRRQSIKPPPPEDTRRKLHVDLVEYNSKMKGAIPVLPLYLAWFCAICNTFFPGLGTLLSGFFCICVGIPRFSHYDSAKARFGSFIINTIVAVAQFFCVLFCFVGWGWSIWWGTIMLKCAKKLSKIKKVERLEMEEERRQQQQAEVVAREAAARATNALENNTETTKT